MNVIESILKLFNWKFVEWLRNFPMLRFLFQKHSSPQNIIIHSQCLCAQHQVVFYVSLITFRFSLSDTFFFIYTFFIIYCTLSRCRWLFNGSSVLQSHPICSETCFSGILFRETLLLQIRFRKKTVLFPGRRSWVRFEGGRTTYKYV